MSDQPPWSADRQSLAEKIAAYCMLKRGYMPCSMPEAAQLSAACDLILVHSDGYSLQFVCIVDRSLHSRRAFALSAPETRAIAERLLPLTGTVNRAKMPVVITIIEVGSTSNSSDGPAHLAEFKREYWNDKRVLNACVVDPLSPEIWTSNWMASLAWKRFLKRVLAGPQVSEAQIAEATQAPLAAGSTPWATYGLITLLAVLFGCELLFGVDKPGPLLTPSVQTLLATGGVQKQIVVDGGQWLRLLTAAFLHGNLLHLAFNLFALYMGGVALERIVGATWLVAVFVLAAVGGSAMSIALNAPNVVGVGASGAVLGIFGCLMALAWRYPPGAIRSSLHMTSIRVLLPTLLTIGKAPGGAQIDFGAHLGGALTGLIIGGLFLVAWPRKQTHAPFQPAALMIVLAALGVVVVFNGPLLRTYKLITDDQALAPPALIGALQADARTGGSRVTTEYPGDPRGWVWVGSYQFDHRDYAAAEKSALQALGKTAIIERVQAYDLKMAARYLLALSVANQGRLDQAKAVSRPVCEQESSFHEQAAKAGFCGP